MHFTATRLPARLQNSFHYLGRAGKHLNNKSEQGNDRHEGMQNLCGTFFSVCGIFIFLLREGGGPSACEAPATPLGRQHPGGQRFAVLLEPPGLTRGRACWLCFGIRQYLRKTMLAHQCERVASRAQRVVVAASTVRDPPVLAIASGKHFSRGPESC